jgi:methyltransferase
MRDAHMSGATWLVGFLVIQRLAELGWARRNTARLRAAGAVEFGAAHYPLMVALHVGWLLALAVYSYGHDVAGWGLAAFVVLQAARLWVIASLGARWTTRVIVVPGSAAVRHGPYRWLRHPNYWVVALEIAVVPLALGLPWLALVFSLLNAALLAWRIRVENRALAWAQTVNGAAAAERGGPASALANETPRR